MSEEKAVKDFTGFAEDLRMLRFTLRSALGLSPMRPLERMRQNTQAMRESIQSRQQQRQMPQQDQRCQGTATPLRGFGIIDRFMQPQQAEEPQQDLTPEEEKAKQQVAEEYHRKELERLKKENLKRVRSLSDLSISEDI